MSLKSDAKFLAKNQLAREAQDCLKPVVIPSLSDLVGQDLLKDRSLCPVRALHYYLDRTTKMRNNKEKLFISFCPGFSKDISANTISAWLKQVIMETH